MNATLPAPPSSSRNGAPSPTAKPPGSTAPPPPAAPAGIVYTSFNDRWSARAALTDEKPVPRRSPAPSDGDERRIGVALPSKALSSLALSPAALEKLRAQGLISGPGIARPVGKDGQALAHLANVRVEFRVVTPGLAADWLRNNFKNRPVSEDVVDAYARDAIAGEWLTTHQGVAFNDADELIDGQHRLLAIVKGGVPCVLMVSFGWPSKIPGKEMTTMDCVDRGRTRSVADQLKIQHGLSNGTQLAFMAAAIASLCCGERTRRLSVGQTLKVYREFERQIDFVLAHKSKDKGLRTAGVLAGFAFALATEKDFDPSAKKLCAVAEMFLLLNSGKGMLSSAEFETARKTEKVLRLSAIERLHHFLLGDEAKLFTPTLNRGLAELTLSTIHLQLAGKSCKTLAATLEGADHFRGLQKGRVEKIAKLFTLPPPPAQAVNHFPKGTE